MLLVLVLVSLWGLSGLGTTPAVGAERPDWKAGQEIKAELVT